MRNKFSSKKEIKEEKKNLGKVFFGALLFKSRKLITTEKLLKGRYDLKFYFQTKEGKN